MIIQSSFKEDLKKHKNKIITMQFGVYNKDKIKTYGENSTKSRRKKKITPKNYSFLCICEVV